MKSFQYELRRMVTGFVLMFCNTSVKANKQKKEMYSYSSYAVHVLVI